MLSACATVPQQEATQSPLQSVVPSVSSQTETSLLPSESTAETEPIDTGTGLTKGVWNNDVYTNDFAGLRFVLPEGWVAATDEELASLMGIASENLTDDQQWILEAAEQTSMYDALIRDPVSGNNVLIYFGNLSVMAGAEDLSEEEFLQLTEQLLTGMEQYQYTFGEPYKTTINGINFLTVRADELNQGFRQYYLLHKQEQYIVGITVTISDNTDVDDILAYFQ